MEHASAPSDPESGIIRTADGTPVLRYAVEQWGEILHVEWLLNAPLDAIKLGFVELLRLLRETECPALLSDSNQSPGDWSGLIPWIRYEFLPAAIDNGLRYLADVLPQDPESSFSMYRWREQTRGLLHHGVFANRTEARQWVQEMLRHDTDRPLQP